MTETITLQTITIFSLAELGDTPLHMFSTQAEAEKRGGDTGQPVYFFPPNHTFYVPAVEL
jgi:hypothetical protein